MAYNFKSIADVEVVEKPTDAANVLIEENGVIKKAPKTAVGGASGGSVEPDMVIAISVSPDVKITAENYVIEHGSVSSVLTAINEGRVPDVRLRFYHPSSDYYYGWSAELHASIYWYGGYMYFGYIVNTPTGTIDVKVGLLCLNSDGTFEKSELKSVSVS